MAGFKVVVTDDRHGDFSVEKEVLDAIGAEVSVCNCDTKEEVIRECRDADGILLNLSPMPAEVIEKLERCKIIARYGVGYDNVDVPACTKKGIYVANVPDYCAEEVSDQALALLMACVRKVVHSDTQIRQGKWNIAKEMKIHRIEGKTFALLGFGMISKAFLRKIKGFNPGRILVFDPFVDAETIASYGAVKVEWEDALSEADYISVHIPLNAHTKGMIDEKAFAFMKPSAILINTSRGAVIDEKAMIKALSSKTINCAGLDVFETEPIQSDNKLRELDNCVLTDHVGWYSVESIIELKRKAAENVRDVLKCGKPKYPVNKI
jgi:D-3-phosphoglycerate dehydrogenase